MEGNERSTERVIHNQNTLCEEKKDILNKEKYFYLIKCIIKINNLI